MSQTVLAKKNKKGEYTAIYKFNYPVDKNRYPGTKDVTKEYRKDKVKLKDFRKEHEKEIREANRKANSRPAK